MIVIATLILVWLPGLMAMAEVWSELEYASHGYLVPLVALWAATAHRQRLARLPADPRRVGFALVAGAAIVYLCALVLESPTVIGLATVAAVAAIALALRGPEWVRTLRFSLGYLIFMVPLPISLVTPLIVQLQLVVSSVAVVLLRVMGVSIYKEGNVLTLPGDTELFVAEACSGITSLITLLPIGVFVAYFTETEWRRRAILVVAVLPIALAGNLLRVILTVILAMEVDVGFATEGPLHEWAGVGTYVLGCLCLLGIGTLMRHVWPQAFPAATA